MKASELIDKLQDYMKVANQDFEVLIDDVNQYYEIADIGIETNKDSEEDNIIIYPDN